MAADPGRGGHWKRSTAIAAAVALLAAAAWLAAAASHGSQRHRPAAAGRSPAAAVTAPRVDTSGWRWSDVDGVMLPSSPADGPHVTTGGLASGFADNPAGAVLAAINIAARVDPGFGPQVFTPTITSQVTGADAAALLAADQQEYGQAAGQGPSTGPDGPPPARVAEKAFRWEDYTPQTATIDLVSSGPAPGGGTVMAATRLQVVWLGGDWRLIAPPGGDFAGSAVQVTTLSGYTVFAQR